MKTVDSEMLTIVEEVVADKVRLRGYDLDKIITYTLLRLGANSSTSGYHYIHKLLKLMVLHNQEYALFKETYYDIAKSFSNTNISRNRKLKPSNIERNIRYSISAMWDMHLNKTNDLMEVLYGGHVSKPNNSTFISILAQYIKLVYFK